MNMEQTALDTAFTHHAHTRVTHTHWAFQETMSGPCRYCYTHTHMCGKKLLIQLSRECFARETVTQYLLMRQKPFCIRGVLTDCMLIITNGSKKSRCSTH